MDDLDRTLHKQSRIPIERLEELFFFDQERNLRWRLDRELVSTGKRYQVVTVDGLTFLLSRLTRALADGRWPISLIDHIDRNPANSHVDNLRHASYSDNSRNGSPRYHKINGLPQGVHHNGKNFIAGIYVDGRQTYLGTFTTVDAAARAYAEAAKLIFGEFSPVPCDGELIHFSTAEEVKNQKSRLANKRKSIERGPYKRKNNDLPKGVYRRQDGKFFSTIRYQGKQVGLGSFDTPEQASEAYQAAQVRIKTGLPPKA